MGLFIIVCGIPLTIYIVKLLLSAPGEFIRLLKQGPSNKLTFIFIGMGLTMVTFFALYAGEVTFNEEPGYYFLAAAGTIILNAIVYYIFLGTGYASVSYFFIVLLKIILVVVPTVALIILTEDIIWAFAYFFVILIITFYTSFKTNKSGVSERESTSTFGGFFKTLFRTIFGSVISFIVSKGMEFLYTKIFEQ